MPRKYDGPALRKSSASLVDILTIGFGIDLVDFGPSSQQGRGQNAGSRTGRCVGQDPLPCQHRNPREVRRKRGQVALPSSCVCVGATPDYQTAELSRIAKKCFTSVLLLICKLASPRSEELDAIVRPGVVTRRNHHAAGGLGMLSQVPGQGGGGEDSKIDDLYPATAESGDDSTPKHRSGAAGVPRKNDGPTVLLLKNPGESLRQTEN